MEATERDGGDEATRVRKQSLAPRMPKKRKSLINIHLKSLQDFDLIRTLGTGSYGRVILARDKAEGVFHAIKVLEKAKVVRKNQVEHTRNELSLLSSMSFEFIVNMKSYFKDNSNIFLVLDFAIGGEMWSHMRKKPGMKEHDAMFYAAQMVLALEYLQERDIVHRDLKTENILIDHTGYLKLADFGFAKRVPSRTWTVCGTSEYMAPEIILEGKRHRAGLGLGDGYSKLVDWWAYGILIFEMANVCPFVLMFVLIACSTGHHSDTRRSLSSTPSFWSAMYSIQRPLATTLSIFCVTY
jgi:serine/threonine protein kinase